MLHKRNPLYLPHPKETRRFLRNGGFFRHDSMSS